MSNTLWTCGMNCFVCRHFPVLLDTYVSGISRWCDELRSIKYVCIYFVWVGHEGSSFSTSTPVIAITDFYTSSHPVVCELLSHFHLVPSFWWLLTPSIWAWADLPWENICSNLLLLLVGCFLLLLLLLFYIFGGFVTVPYIYIYHTLTYIHIYIYVICKLFFHTEFSFHFFLLWFTDVLSWMKWWEILEQPMLCWLLSVPPPSSLKGA